MVFLFVQIISEKKYRHGNLNEIENVGRYPPDKCMFQGGTRLENSRNYCILDYFSVYNSGVFDWNRVIYNNKK